MVQPQIDILENGINTDVLDLWRKVYFKELRWIDDVSANVIEDGYHHDCVYILAKMDNKPVGTARIVFPQDGLLPVERNAGGKQLIPSHLKKTELTRLMVLNEYRGQKCSLYPDSIFHHLMNTYLSWAKQNNIYALFMDVRHRNASYSLVEKLEHYDFICLGNEYPDPLGSQFPYCTTMLRLN